MAGSEPRGLVILLTVGASMLLVLAATAGAWLLSDDDDSIVVAAPTSSTTTTEASPTSTTEGDSEPSGASPELEAAVEELSAFVEDERGLEFRERVVVELAGDDEFEQRLLDDFEEEDEQDVRDTESIFRALGLLEPGVDLVEQLKELLSAGVVGFYDPETNELVVRGAELTPYTRQTIAHELVHALDDQHFELFRPELDDAEDESGFGFSALGEGDAVRVEEVFEQQLSPEEQDERLQEEASIGSDTDFSQFPVILLTLLAAPYEVGPPLVDTILEEEGQPALDVAFEEPPTTSEQVLHPEAFLDGEGAIPVPRPDARGEVFDEGIFGELIIRLLLPEGGAAVDTAQEAALGWGGDQYVAWREGDRTCIRVAFVMDSRPDLTELGDALTDWAASQDAARVRVGAERVLLTSCG